jgi:hypothetical protein
MAQKQQPLEKQAERIINDPNKYDADTRNVIGVARSNLIFHRKDTGTRDHATAERELRALINKAEAGEYVFDVEEIGESYVKAARTIYGVITEANDIPQFVYDAVTVALEEAQRRTGCRLCFLPTGCEDFAENYGYSIERMARLFKQDTMLRIEVEVKKDLSEMIAAVIEHPDCPQEIRDGINEATSSLFNRLNDDDRKVYYTAPYIHALIVESKVQEGSQP